MSLNLVTLTWDFTDFLRSGIPAVLSMAPTEVLKDPADGLIIADAIPRPVTFVGAGQVAGVIANDNTAISPSGSGYVVSVVQGGVVVLQETVVINFATGATQDLSSLLPASVNPGVLVYMPLPSGTPSPGQVPAATGTGQASAWTTPSNAPVTTVFGRTGAVVAANGDYTAAQVGADASGAASTAQASAETFATAAVATETSRAETAEGLKAPLASPALTGTPTAPTQSAGNNSTRLATTAYVDGKIVSGQFLCAPNQYAPSSPQVFSTTSAVYSAVSSGNACTNSFIAPPSGSVLVEATFVYHMATASTAMGWALAVTGTVTPLVANAWQVLPANTTLSDMTSVPFLVSGLTPGSTYQFDLLFATSSSGSALSVAVQALTSTTVSSSKEGPVLMTVRAV